MEELMSIGTNIATLIAIGVATVSAVIVAFAGFQYATASGDPQKIGIAKSSFVGAFIGLVIASLAFIGPRIVTDMVIKPVGGVALDTQVGLNCDSVLRNQLIFQRGASTKDRMQVVISQIQAQQQECAKDVWKPVAIDLGVPNTSAGTIATGYQRGGPGDGADVGQCYESNGGFATAVSGARQNQGRGSVFAGGFGEGTGSPPKCIILVPRRGGTLRTTSLCTGQMRWQNVPRTLRVAGSTFLG